MLQKSCLENALKMVTKSLSLDAANISTSRYQQQQISRYMTIMSHINNAAAKLETNKVGLNLN